MNSPLKFQLVVQSIQVTLVGLDGEEETTYEIREMVASVRDKYLDQLGERMKVGPDGKIAGVKKFDGLQAALLEKCLYDLAGALVKKETIQSWPASTVSSLFDEAQKINSLNSTTEEVAEGAKKD